MYVDRCNDDTHIDLDPRFELMDLHHFSFLVYLEQIGIVGLLAFGRLMRVKRHSTIVFIR